MTLAERLRELADWIGDLSDSPNALKAKAAEVRALADEVEGKVLVDADHLAYLETGGRKEDPETLNSCPFCGDGFEEGEDLRHHLADDLCKNASR